MLKLLLKLITPKRPPDQIIGHVSDPYLKRWWIIPRNPWFNVYLHCFLRSDDDRALHDHPWDSVSWMLDGQYIEIIGDKYFLREPGEVYGRKATTAHRIELTHYQKPGVWTLFFTGPWKRHWGFHCPKGWVHWRDFTHPDDSGLVGRGCGEND